MKPSDKRKSADPADRQTDRAHGFFRRPFLFTICFMTALLGFTAYVLLDAFIIPRSYTVVSQSGTAVYTSSTSSSSSSSSSDTSGTELTAGSAVSTSTSYTDNNAAITLTTYRENDTNIYVADIQLSSSALLKTAFANDTFGKNITQVTSKLAAAHNAILAINGDYYSARSGYVIRDGVLYRSTSAGSSQEDLVIYQDGSFEIITEGSISAEQLLANGAWQVLSFGPALVENGQIAVSTTEEVGQAMTSNPRTAIGILGNGHYIMVVSDGRTSASSGLTLYQLAEFTQSLGATTVYNLDGGGSSTMYFNGSVVNQPTTNGKTISERSVSDIVYIGY